MSKIVFRFLEHQNHTHIISLSESMFRRRRWEWLVDVISSWLSSHQIEKQSQYDEAEASQQKKYDARSHAWVLSISNFYELRAKMRRKISISSIKKLTFTARLNVSLSTHEFTSMMKTFVETMIRLKKSTKKKKTERNKSHIWMIIIRQDLIYIATDRNTIKTSILSFKRKLKIIVEILE